MTARSCVAVIGIFMVLLATGTSAALQKVLVTCTSDACEFRRVSTFAVGGRQSVRVLAASSDNVGPAELKRSREIHLDQLKTLYRDGASGFFYIMEPDGTRRQLALPAKATPKSGDSISSEWQTAGLEYTDSTQPKNRTSVPNQSFAYLLVSPDADVSVVQLLQRLVETPESDPRRGALIRGAIQFAGKSTPVQRWRTTLETRMREDLKQFEEQTGDPTKLADAIREAASVRAIYVQISAEAAEKDLLDQIKHTSDLFETRLGILNALRSGSYWDEYVAKSQQLGLAKWSIPQVVDNAQQAASRSTTFHQDRFTALAASNNWALAFDEAELASHMSCEAGVADAFYQARVLFVNHNQIPSSQGYGGKNKALLEQTVRELDQLDPTKEQVTFDRIRRGEDLDPSYLPLQLKKAEFLDKLGRFKEALAVIQRIERNVRLDGAQLDECLRLDGRITNNLTDALGKSVGDTRKQFEQGQYKAAYDAAAIGLKADAENATLLSYSALSAAFLRQNDTAAEFVRRYLRDSNTACLLKEDATKILELTHVLSTRTRASQNPDGVPHWISGARYAPGQVFYDPVSLGLFDPIFRVTSQDGLETIFEREGRSVFVKSISTVRSSAKAGNGSALAVFGVEPKYDRQTSTMVEIASKANSAGDRTVHSLTYSTSPTIDADLVFQLTGRQIARGWAGNPFFHPFIWNGVYLFDLSYDRRGRVIKATPVQDESGQRADPFSEPLQFAWDADSFRLLSVKGTRSGYLRELHYDKEGRLRSETIKYRKGHGTIDYDYAPDGRHFRSARSEDNFFDKRKRVVTFEDVLQR